MHERVVLGLASSGSSKKGFPPYRYDSLDTVTTLPELLAFKSGSSSRVSRKGESVLMVSVRSCPSAVFKLSFWLENSSPVERRLRSSS